MWTMARWFAAWAAAALVLSCARAAEHTGGHDGWGDYTHTWAVHVPGGRDVADSVAAEHGFVNLGEIFDSHYHFAHARLRRRSTRAAPEHHARLERDSRVAWARQQRLLRRVKRDFVAISLPDTLEEESEDRWKREASSKIKGRLRSVDKVIKLNDPKWPSMWYLNRTGAPDMNVLGAWREGITGRGVVVSILDDGLETDHPDFVANYDAQASYDVNSHDSDPTPRYDMTDSNRHGTRCAGEVVATANNSVCAVGVAYDAKVGGVRMLDGDVTDAVEARSLSLNPQHVDIYSASWGPDDDGKTVDGPGELATRAFIEGVTKGRNGKGSIFVWASGNGGRDHDSCNCDGYTNSIWTLSISSATERGDVPWYSEACSSTLAATYSSGTLNEKQIVTTDLHHGCTTQHSGTSASAPLAAGICALALQANKNLTWRDMQHIVVRTARSEHLSPGGEWRVNGVGRNVSHAFGYGLMDATAMVRLARTWRNVPPQKRCELAAARPERAIPARGSVVLQLDVQYCPGVNYLEHVQARVTLSCARRGDMQIFLTSPAGTRVSLLSPRSRDDSRAGFNSWPFMSVHMWGESPIGVWQLEVHNEGRYMGDELKQWELIFYGTETVPQDEEPQHSSAAPQHPQHQEKTVDFEPPRNEIDDIAVDLWEHDRKGHDSTSASVSTSGATSGCVARAGSGDICIECAEALHLYAGRCYAVCPAHTFVSLLKAPTHQQKIHDGSASLIKRAPISNSEADDMVNSEVGSKLQKICVDCHYSCATCRGPNNHDCLSCLSDAELVKVATPEIDQLFCIPSSITPQVKESLWYSKPKVIISIAIIIIGSFLLYMCCSAAVKYGFCEFCCCSNDADSIGFDKVSYDKVAQDEAQKIKEDIERAVRDSDTESDDDLPS